MTLDPTRFQRTTNGCLEWAGARDAHGYGRVKIGGRDTPTLYVHRVMWEQTHGPIPAGLFVLHHCDNPPCAEQTHLFLGTQADNVADMDAKGRRVQSRGKTRLTVEQVLAIRADQRPPAQVAPEYGIARCTVSNIRARRIWKTI